MRLRLLGLVAIVLVAGCRVEVAVGIDVARDGSGTIEVAVGLDEEALEEVPRLAEELEVDDLQAAGWTITGPTEEDDGWTWVRASKPFTSLDQAGAVLAEITGREGPIRGFAVEREVSSFSERWRLEGTVDLSQGLDAFSDDGLRARLDGTSFGVDIAELERRAGVPLEEAVRFRVAARLPGELTSNAALDVGGTAVWHPVLGEDTRLEASGRIADLGRITLAGVAAGTAALGGLVLGVQALRARARRRRAVVVRHGG